MSGFMHAPSGEIDTLAQTISTVSELPLFSLVQILGRSGHLQVCFRAQSNGHS
jgi:hypothetical protein